MRFPLDETVDDPAEGEETLVDLARLPGPLVHGSGSSNVFGSRQIHQVQLALDILLLADNALLGDGDRDSEDGVGPGAGRVHFGGGRRPLLGSLLQDLEHGVLGRDDALLQTLDDHRAFLGRVLEDFAVKEKKT